MHTRTSGKRNTSSNCDSTSVKRLIQFYQSTNQPINPSSRQSINRPVTISKPINQLINQSIECWRDPPSFIVSVMLSYLDGRSVAVHSRINTTWRSQLQSCTSSGHYALDIDTSVNRSIHQSMDAGHSPMSTDDHLMNESFDYGDESCYDMFSTPTDAILYAAFQLNNQSTNQSTNQSINPSIHCLRSLMLSTARLTQSACDLLGQLVYLESLELRLFESVAYEWHSLCLTSQQMTWHNDKNHPLNHFQSINQSINQSVNQSELFVDERALPALSYTHLHDEAIRSFTQSLKQSLHKLCHLKSLTIVSYLDEDVTDASTNQSTNQSINPSLNRSINLSTLYPALRHQSQAIIDAISYHPTLQEIRFVEPRVMNFNQSSNQSTTFHPKWIDTIPNLKTVHVTDAVSAIPVTLMDIKKE